MIDPVLLAVGFFVSLVTFGSFASAAQTARLGPRFVLQEFVERRDRHGPSVLIRGRRAGLAAFILSALGLDNAVSFRFRRGELEIRFSSLNGETYHRIPVHSIASTHAGYSRQVGLVILAAAVAGGGLFAAGQARGDEQGVVVVGSLVLAGVLLLAYSLSKSIRIAVESAGGMLIAIRFQGSLIEGKRVDLEAARRVCRAMGDSALSADASSSVASRVRSSTDAPEAALDLDQEVERDVEGSVVDDEEEPSFSEDESEVPSRPPPRSKRARRATQSDDRTLDAQKEAEGSAADDDDDPLLAATESEVPSEPPPRSKRVRRAATSSDQTSTTRAGSTWTCRTCGQKHAASFEACWKCGSLRDTV